ncbi:MAG: ATP-binding protein [Sorangiineae bacterium]|nr:ATP-binding protein [Polyangiaceae bacterium]MEB2321200.1 ATP-binding protein [Sorangiineae bacterium]
MGSLRQSSSPALLSNMARAIIGAAEYAGIGIVVTSGDGRERRARFLNHAAGALLGYESGETVPDEGVERAAAALIGQVSAEGRAGAREVELPRKDGSLWPVSAASSSVLIDGAPARVDFFYDALERRVVEEKLRHSESRFRALIDAAPDAIAVSTASGLSYVNDALRRMLDERGDAERVSPEQHLHPDDLARVRKYAAEVREGGARLPPFEVRVTRGDGRQFSAEVITMKIEWGGEDAVLFIGRDLSERQALQAELVQAARLTAVGTLAAGVAHEINNPLAYVLLNLEYVMREVPRAVQDPERLRDLAQRLAEARHGAERVGTIVRDLRAFSRTDAEKTGPVDLERVVSSALRVAGPQLSGRARLTRDFDPVRPVHAEATRLEQVFLNLLINAAQALPEGGAEHHEVRVAIRSAGVEHVAVEVTDDGEGIAPEALARVFEPFFTTKPAGIGTGLGLSICQRIVAGFGGEITASSELGRGTTFRVTLPVDTSASVAPERRRTTPAPSLAGRARVLIVDDELPVASMLRLVLSDEHEVCVSTSAREALELLTSGETFDVVLCDLLMPGMSGMELHQQLAARGTGIEKRVVFMTGGAFTPRAAEFLASSPNPRLEKPFDLTAVRRLVGALARSARGSG